LNWTAATALAASALGALDLPVNLALVAQQDHAPAGRLIRSASFAGLSLIDGFREITTV
jgi:hypothetical protein